MVTDRVVDDIGAGVLVDDGRWSFCRRRPGVGVAVASTETGVGRGVIGVEICVTAVLVGIGTGVGAVSPPWVPVLAEGQTWT